MRKATSLSTPPSHALAPLPDFWRDLQESLPPLSSPQTPSLSTYTSVLAHTASLDEAAAWDEALASSPSLPDALLAPLGLSASDPSDLDLSALLERGRLLASSLPPLSPDLQDALAPAPPPSTPPPSPSWSESLRTWLSPLRLSLAAAAAAFLLFPFTFRPSSEPPSGLRAKGSSLQPKGQSSTPPTPKDPPIHFSFFHRRDTQIQKGHDQMIVRPGDELRFAYRNLSGQTPYLLLFLVDERGTFSPLYPASEKTYFSLHQGPILYLPDGATLDDSPSLERIFVCVSSIPHSLEDAKRSLQTDLKRTPLDRLQRLSLSCRYQASWLLKKATITP